MDDESRKWQSEPELDPRVLVTQLEAAWATLRKFVVPGGIDKIKAPTPEGLLAISTLSLEDVRALELLAKQVSILALSLREAAQQVEFDKTGVSPQNG